MAPPLPMRPLEEYFLEEIDKKPINTKIYDEKIYFTPGGELNEIQQRTKCLDKILLEERKRHEGKKEEFQRRWAVAAKTIQDVDETLTKINNPYIDQQHTISRLLETIDKESEINVEKSKTISRLTKEKDVLNQVLEVLTSRVDQFKIFEEYLDTVVKSSSGEFKDVEELVDKITLLIKTRDSLLKKHQSIQLKMDKREKELKNRIQIGTNSDILLNNLILDLNNDYIEDKSNCQRLENILSHVKTTEAKKSRMLGKLKMSTFDLYRRLNKAFGQIPKIDQNDSLKQLEYIRITLIHLNSILQTVHTEVNKNKEGEKKVRKARKLNAHGRWEKAIEEVRANVTTTNEINIERRMFHLPMLNHISKKEMEKHHK